jgi:methylaspartate mutase sigma subunit
VFLGLLLAEHGCVVVNIGPCPPDSLVLSECWRVAPDLVVISSVNGHGHVDGARVVRLLRTEPCLAGVPIVIGGQLGVRGSNDLWAADLIAAGCTDVFLDDDVSLRRFRLLVDSIAVRTNA